MSDETDLHPERSAAAREDVPDATVISSRPAGEVRQTSVAEIGRSLEGRSLGPYRLERFVGGGGMGAVFRALDTTLDRIVAVKVLSRQQSDDEEMLRRFRNEAQSAARLDHENIGRVHAVGTDDGWHYIVFEFIEGTNLRDVVQRDGPFGVARTIDVTIQVADALEHASQRNVVHRDVKPSNIIITPGGRARVVDMGLARLHHMAGEQDLTVSGMTLGTFDYISPEQARDPRSADVRSDLYSLGCTMFFMLVGRPPFAEGTMVQKLLAHQQDSPPSIESLRPDVPKRLGEILTRLMRKEPDDRYQRPADLMADLAAVADELGLELAVPRPVTGAVTSAAAPSLAVHVPWLVPLLCLAALVGALWLKRFGPSARVAPALHAPWATAERNETFSGDEASRAAPEEPRILRVVEVPTADDDFGSLGEAVRQAGDGDVVEIACLEPRDDGPFMIDGRRVTIRAAVGTQPIVRFGEWGGEGPGGRWCTVSSGTLELQDVTLRPALLAATGRRQAVIAMQGASALVCERVAFALAGDASASMAGVRAERRGDDRQEVRMTDSSFTGGGVFLESGPGTTAEGASSAAEAGGGQIDLFWFGGRVVTPGRFLLVEGSTSAARSGAGIRITLDHGLFACGTGLVCLTDSPTLRVFPSLRGLARGCRFMVPEGHGLLEQTGIGDPEAYRPAVEWVDIGSRYEGSGVFRRIDGAAERMEMDYTSQPQSLDHSLRIDGWPQAD
ncbi:MAG: serine/threonine-protein kinase [Planctomycetia bacterium]